MNRRPSATTLTITFLATFIVATYSFLLLTTPYLFFTSASLDQDTARAMYSIVNNNSFVYGTIAAVDATTSSIDLDVADRFNPGNPPKRFHISIESPAYIAAQQLVVENGVVTSISQAAVTDLSHISIGSHAAVSIMRHKDAALASHYVLFGDPL